MRIAQHADCVPVWLGAVFFSSAQGPQPIFAAAAGVAQDAVVDWGHLKADVVHYGGGARQYDLLVGGGSGDEGGGGGAGPPPHRAAPPQQAPHHHQASGANTAPLPPR